MEKTNANTPNGPIANQVSRFGHFINNTGAGREREAALLKEARQGHLKGTARYDAIRKLDAGTPWDTRRDDFRTGIKGVIGIGVVTLAAIGCTYGKELLDTFGEAWYNTGGGGHGLGATAVGAHAELAHAGFVPLPDALAGHLPTPDAIQNVAVQQM